MEYRKTCSLLAGVFLLLISPSTLQAQLGNVDQAALQRPDLVILGTYHMSSTSSNVINVEADDVTRPERQQQIHALISRLKAFRPTKVALECDLANQAHYQERYQDYIAGGHELGRDEREQIGFRLAKAMSHPAVYCVDWSDFPDDPSYNYEKYARQHPALDRYLAELYADNQKTADRKADEIASRTIIESLIEMNRPEAVERANKWYYRILRIGRGDESVGANYVGWWHRRNLKILANIIRITESPEDRILVVYGAGHNKLLNQFARESGFYDVGSPLAYLQE